MYHGSGTIVKTVSQLTSHAFGGLASSRWTLLYSQQRAAGRRYGRHLASVTSYKKFPSIDACLLEENITKFHPDLIWNDGGLSLVHTGDYRRSRRLQSPVWKRLSASLKSNAPTRTRRAALCDQFVIQKLLRKIIAIDHQLHPIAYTPQTLYIILL